MKQTILRVLPVFHSRIQKRNTIIMINRLVMCQIHKPGQSPAFGNPPSTDRLHDNTQQALENALIQERERNKDN